MTSPRPVLIGAAAAILVAAGLGLGILLLHGPDAEAAGETLPLPPEVPRLAEGRDYTTCLDLLREDADEARDFAENWAGRGGGEGAKHCLALAMLGQGEAERAGERLEDLARTSTASAGTRSAVFAQAVQAWVMAGQSGRAFAAATMGLTLTPNDVDLLLDRAIALGMLNRHQESLGDLDRALVLDPLRGEAWVFRAAALRHLDRVAQAAAAVERALALNADNPEALLERGIIRQIQGNTAGARADWQRAIDLSPDSAAADLAQQNLALNEAGPQRR